MHLRAPYELGGAFDDVGQTERRHEQGDGRLVGERPQHGALDGDADRYHDGESDDQRQCERHAALDQADEGERCEQQQRALREIEHARGLVDQHEADRDKRIHDAGEQAADEHLDEELVVEIGDHMPALPSLRERASLSEATPR